ncbi:hypothetical protein ACH5RR_018053 [Cinchona calisaya]|uniref:Uncharacterized protein n=1 Tax=Cinchona calisaya TaxID=153742 RepID=A0ABD2ZL94_9GENT
MRAVPEELMATLPNKLIGIDNQKVQDVHMWFGGHIEWESKASRLYHDITTPYLKCDEDVKLWATIWDHLPHLEVFAKKIDQASRLTSKEQSRNAAQLAAVEQTLNQQQTITKGKRSKRTATKAKGKNDEAEAAEKINNDEAEEGKKRIMMMQQQRRITIMKQQAMLSSRLKRKNLNG